MDNNRCEICNREFNHSEGLIAHNAAKHPEFIPKERKPFPTKKIRNWAILLLLIGLGFWGVYGMATSINGKTIVDESNLAFDAPTGPIHWHPKLTIKINGIEQNIPQNIGIAPNNHFPTHTHDTSGTIHLENNNPTKKTVTLGYFFEVWGKKLSKDCIFDYCTDNGGLKMYVDGKENLEFENYFLQDGDDILIEYTANA